MRHLKEVDEGYREHAAFALKGAAELLLIALVLAVHAVCPWWFTRTASTRMRKLLDNMMARYSK